MRRLLTILAAASLVAPAAALAAHRDPSDGTLVVRNASGDSKTLQSPVVGLALNGAVVGRFDRGRLTVFPTDDQVAVVVTDDNGDPVEPTAIRESGAEVYSGLDLRFKAVGGFYRLGLSGSGIDLNAVGHGTVVLDGSSEDPKADGWYSLNGADKKSLPAERTGFQIGS
jgi:hypothetical protein